jgi:HNH endonuclease
MTDILEIFPDRVSPEPNSGCWLWTAAVASHGYGTLNKNTTAHRYSCQLSFGPIPEGMLALHKCDNKLCVNPAHLYLGTKSDNGRDAYARGQNGRQIRRRRENHQSALLTVDQVKEIRSLPHGRQKRGAGVISDMATRFGVSAATIYDVRLGRSWQ